LKTLGGGFGAWFAEQARDAGAPAPPGWKMALCVVLGLYPTVMLLSMTVGRVTDRWGLALSMLVGNALSVSILQWGVMPVLTRLLKTWLQANDAANPRLMLGGLASCCSRWRRWQRCSGSSPDEFMEPRRFSRRSNSLFALLILRKSPLRRYSTRGFRRRHHPWEGSLAVRRRRISPSACHGCATCR
jgi:hypothetical protein